MSQSNVSRHSYQSGVSRSTRGQSQSEVVVTESDRHGKQSEIIHNYAKSELSKRPAPPASSTASSSGSGTAIKLEMPRGDGKASSTISRDSRGTERRDNKVTLDKSNKYNPGAHRAPIKAPRSHKPTQRSTAPPQDDEVTPDQSISVVSRRSARPSNATSSAYTDAASEEFAKGLAELELAKDRDSGQRIRRDEPQSKGSRSSHTRHSREGSRIESSTERAKRKEAERREAERREAERREAERREAEREAEREAARREAEIRRAEKKRQERKTSNVGSSHNHGYTPSSVSGHTRSSASGSTVVPSSDHFSQVHEGSRPGTELGARTESVAGSRQGTELGARTRSVAGSRQGTELGARTRSVAGCRPGTELGARTESVAGSRPGTSTGREPETGFERSQYGEGRGSYPPPPHHPSQQLARQHGGGYPGPGRDREMMYEPQRRPTRTQLVSSQQQSALHVQNAHGSYQMQASSSFQSHMRIG